MVMGGTHPRGKTAVVVTALLDDLVDVAQHGPEDLVSRADGLLDLVDELPGARTATVQAATDLYGAAAAATVTAAWDCVGAPGGAGGGGGVTTLTNGVTRDRLVRLRPAAGRSTRSPFRPARPAQDHDVGRHRRRGPLRQARRAADADRL